MTVISNKINSILVISIFCLPLKIERNLNILDELKLHMGHHLPAILFDNIHLALHFIIHHLQEKLDTFYYIKLQVSDN